MIPDEPLRQTPTHSSDTSEGRALGLDLHRTRYVMAAILLGLLPGSLVIGTFGLVWAAISIFGPALIVAMFQFLFLQDKPPGWLFDWLETRLAGGHMSPLRDHKP